MNKPLKSLNIMNLIRDEVITDVLYFEEASRDTHLNKYKDDNDLASSHANDIFDFLFKVKENLEDDENNESDEKDTFLEKVSNWTDDLSDVTGSIDEVEEYIIKHILPDDSANSSYTNSYTNIKRLYEYYPGNDYLNKSQNDMYYLERLKVYASGFGTIDAHDATQLGEDKLRGLAVGA